MSRQQFIDCFKHELVGLVMDAATSGRTGADLGLFARLVCKQVDAKLGVMYDQLTRDTAAKPATTGEKK
jgi:capsid protein